MDTFATFVFGVAVMLSAVQATSFNGFKMPQQGLSDVLLREMVARMGNDLVDPSRDYPDLDGLHVPIEGISPKSLPGGMPMDYDELQRMQQPSIRDQEYLSHSSLLGSYGFEDVLQRLKTPPGGQGGAVRGAAKTSGGGTKPEGVLPAYCTPPNPCPVGYTAEDGCIEEFENTAGFSRDYQAMQECMCDTEHMFRCPDSTPDSEITALARSIQNDGVLDSQFSKILNQMNNNPYLAGEKLPIAAKKGYNVW